MRSKIFLRVTCCLAILSLGAGSAGASRAADAAATAQTVQFEIKPQPLASALNALALQAHQQILFTPEIAKGKTTQGVRGALTAEAALSQLLAGTGLSSSKTGDGMVLVSQADAREASATSGPPNAPSGAEKSQRATNSGSEPRKDSSLEEIVVTAEKRIERLQDVPVPVTVLSAQVLADRNALRLEDYYDRVPGLTLTPGTESTQDLSIRGISTGGFTNPTVGITVDDVPFGASTWLGGGLVVPDIDPFDLARIEVLRGPQGTLYGASSMGGLMKFVTVDPTTEGVSGRIEAGTSSVHNGAQLGYDTRAAINVPLGDTLAFRASGFTRIDPGYIDNPILHIDGINKATANGGDFKLLWTPSDVVSLKLGALYQHIKTNGADEIDVPTAGYPQSYGLGDLQQNYLPGTGGYDRRTQAYSATLKAHFEGFELTSISGYNKNGFNDSADYTYAFGAIAALVFPNDTGSPLYTQNNTDKFTQELRLTGSLTPKFDWLVGGFYTHEGSHYNQEVTATDPTTGAFFAKGLFLGIATTYQEFAGFADLTYHFTDRFDVQLGGRESRIKQTTFQTETGPYAPILNGTSAPPAFPEADSRNNAFTYLLTPRFKVSQDLMVYARLASGYRAGGPNLIPGGPVPAQYSPDKTQDYEVGVKGDFLQHELTLDVSAYYIKWQNIQLQGVSAQTQLTYQFNGSAAKSQGLELTAESKPWRGAQLGGWVSFNDAVLTDALPSAGSSYGNSGDRLPNSARFSGGASAQQEFPLWEAVRGDVEADLSYIGYREGPFGPTPPTEPFRQAFPGYADIDLRAGAKWTSWKANVFVSNLADKRGVLGGGFQSFPPFGFLYIRPRTVGLNISVGF